MCGVVFTACIVVFSLLYSKNGQGHQCCRVGGSFSLINVRSGFHCLRSFLCGKNGQGRHSCRVVISNLGVLSRVDALPRVF